MKKTVLIIIGVALLAGALGTWFFLENFKRVTRERDLPMQGEARYTSTTEVYPDSPRATPEECIAAQVAAVCAAVEFVCRIGR